MEFTFELDPLTTLAVQGLAANRHIPETDVIRDIVTKYVADNALEAGGNRNIPSIKALAREIQGQYGEALARLAD